MIKDGPASRSPQTAMRDLLRRLEREATRSRPMRPNPPMGGAMALAALPSADTTAAATTVAVGDWLLSQDDDTGDLIATNTQTGSSTTVARRGGT